MKSYLFLFNFMSPFSRKKLYGGEIGDNISRNTLGLLRTPLWFFSGRFLLIPDQ